MSVSTDAIIATMTQYLKEQVKQGTLTSENCTKAATKSKIFTGFCGAHKDISRAEATKVYAQVIKTLFTDEDNTAEPAEEPSENTETTEPVEETSTQEEEPPAEETKTKAKRTPAPRKTAQRKAKTVDERVENDDEPKTNKGKKKNIGAKKPAKEVKRIHATCKGLALENPNSTFNVEPAEEIQDFPEFEIDLEEAEEEFLKSFLTEEQIENYQQTRTEFLENVQKLREDYEITEKKIKKQQKFTLVKSKHQVKFVNPEDGKVAFLPDEEAEPFFTFETFMTDFTKEFKKAIKPPSTKGMSKDEKAALKLKPLDYLTSSVIHTQNIIKEQVLSKCPNVDSEEIIKLTNTVLDQVDDDELLALIEPKQTRGRAKADNYAPDYFQLFIDLKSFNGAPTSFARLCKTLYNHRAGIINHPKLTKSLKKKAWLQALANIQALQENITIDNEVQQLILDCWRNVLESKYAFFIVMHGMTPNDYFKKGFEQLIQHPLSIKWYESALYPISFLFTPNMLGYSDYTPSSKVFGTTDATYKKNLQLELEAFGSASTNLFSYEACNWLYYFNKKDVENNMISLLHQAVILLDKPTTTRAKKQAEEE